MGGQTYKKARICSCLCGCRSCRWAGQASWAGPAHSTALQTLAGGQTCNLPQTCNVPSCRRSHRWADPAVVGTPARHQGGVPPSSVEAGGQSSASHLAAGGLPSSQSGAVMASRQLPASCLMMMHPGRGLLHEAVHFHDTYRPCSIRPCQPMSTSGVLPLMIDEHCGCCRGLQIAETLTPMTAAWGPCSYCMELQGHERRAADCWS